MAVAALAVTTFTAGLMGNVANAVYNHSKTSNATWEDVRGTYKRTPVFSAPKN